MCKEYKYQLENGKIKTHHKQRCTNNTMCCGSCTKRYCCDDQILYLNQSQCAHNKDEFKAL